MNGQEGGSVSLRTVEVNSDLDNIPSLLRSTPFTGNVFSV